MSRTRCSMIAGCGVLLVLWLLGQFSFTEPVAFYLLFPGQAVGSVLFGHDHPVYLFLVSLGTNLLSYSVLCYLFLIFICYVRNRRGDNAGNIPVRPA